jgi:hypothetical protein
MRMASFSIHSFSRLLKTGKMSVYEKRTSNYQDIQHPASAKRDLQLLELLNQHSRDTNSDETLFYPTLGIPDQTNVMANLRQCIFPLSKVEPHVIIYGTSSLTTLFPQESLGWYRRWQKRVSLELESLEILVQQLHWHQSQMVVFFHSDLVWTAVGICPYTVLVSNLDTHGCKGMAMTMWANYSPCDLKEDTMNIIHCLK